MGQPITWRNVQGASPAEAVRPLLAAQQSFNGGFDVLNKLLEQRQATQVNNVAVGNEMAKQSYLDTLQSAKTPEELAAMQATLATQQAALPLAARAATRGAEDARIAGLRQNVLAQGQYDDTTRDRSEADVRDEIASLAVTNPAAAAARLQEVKLRQEAPIAAAIAQRQRQVTTEGQADTRFKWDGDMQPGKVDLQRAQIAGAGITNATGAINLAELKDTVQQKQITDNVVGTNLKDFDSALVKHTDGIKALTAAGGYPKDDSGMPAFGKFTPVQLDEFKAKTAEAKLDSPPSSSMVVESTRRALAAAGVKPTNIASSIALVDKLAKSGTPLSTEDQASIDAANKRATTKETDAEANNPFFTPVNKVLNEKTRVLGTVESLVKDGPMTKTSIRSELSKYMDDGMGVKDPKTGKVVMMKIPPKVVEAALVGGLESDTWISNDTVSNAREIIQSMMLDPKYDDLRKEAEELHAGKHYVERKQARERTQEAANTRSGPDAISDLNREIARRTNGTSLKKYD